MANVTLRNVRKTYAGGFEAIKGIDFEVGDGQFCVLVGPSGCGKSTLLRMVAGLETITGGEIDIGGRVVNEVEPADRDIAMVFQNYALYPHMSVYNNMAYGLRNRGMPEAEIETRVEEAARILELDADAGAQAAAALRRPAPARRDGPRHRAPAKGVSVRRAAVEPRRQAAHRDARRDPQIAAPALSTTSIYVTHDQLEAMTLADILVVMNGGQVEQIGNPLDIYQKPATTFVASFIGAPPMNLMPLRSGRTQIATRRDTATKPAFWESAPKILSSPRRRWPAASRLASPWKRSKKSAPKPSSTAPGSARCRASPPTPANCRRAK